MLVFSVKSISVYFYRKSSTTSIFFNINIFITLKNQIVLFGLVWFGLVWFHGISTIIGYLMPNSVYTYLANT